MDRFERELLDQGYNHICGTDEAGRGPLAGPVVAAAVILDPAKPIPGIADSKTLTAKTRERLAELIRTQALAYAIAFVDVAEIDAINILEASRKAMVEAVKKLSLAPDYILTDAMRLPASKIPVLAIIKGDALSVSIAAASILAKTARDAHMRELSKLYPGYGFARHMGYPTREHLQAIDKLGILDIHRRSFKPIKSRLVRQLGFDFRGDTHE